LGVAGGVGPAGRGRGCGAGRGGGWGPGGFGEVRDRLLAGGGLFGLVVWAVGVGVFGACGGGGRFGGRWGRIRG
jgi:hypothetical protein